MASEFIIGTDTSPVELTGLNPSLDFIGVQVNQTGLDASITLKLKQSQDGGGFKDLPEAPTVMTTGDTEVFLESNSYKFDKLFLDISVGSATVGTLEILSVSRESKSLAELTVAANGDDLTWNFDISTADTDPGTNKFKYNNATPANVTFIYINDSSRSGAVSDSIFSSLAQDDLIYIEDSEFNTQNQIYKISEPATDGIGYWKIPVVHQQGAMLPLNQNKCFFRFFSSIKRIPPYNEGITNFDSRYTSATNGSPVNVVQVKNKLNAIPIVIKRNVTADRIGINVVVAGTASSVATLAIYENKVDEAYPGDLLLNAGEVAIDSTGIKEITISQVLTRGTYWLILFHDSTANPTFKGINANSHPNYLGASSALGTAIAYLNLSLTYTTSLPDPYTSGAATLATNPPAIGLRFS